MISVRRMFLGAVGIVAFFPALAPVSDPDFFWHVRVGGWILDHGAIPTHDLFTYTVHDHAFVAHEWLSEVIMTLLQRSFGLGAVALLFGLLTWAAFLLLMATPRAGYVLAGLAMGLGFAAGNPIWGPRTQMVTFAFSVVLLYCLRRYRASSDRRWLYPLPPLFLLWVNLHAGFTIGLVFLVIYLVGEVAVSRFQPQHPRPPLKPLLFATAASAAAAAVNPNFLGIYSYAAATQFSPAQQRLIVEWFSPNFHDGSVRFFEAMLVGTLVLLALARAKPRLTDLLLLVTAVALALQSVRHIALFVAVVTPILAELAQDSWEQLRERGARFREPRTTTVIGAANALVLLLVAAVVLFGRVIPVAAAGDHARVVTADFPVAALDRLGPDLPPGNVFNDYGWGGYLVYRAWPQRPVYIYGDAAVMGDRFLLEYESIANIHPDFIDVLARRDVTWVLVRRSSALDNALSAAGGWAPVYRDEVSSVLVRRTPATAGYLARHGQG